jgi:hypothetical protein
MMARTGTSESVAPFQPISTPTTIRATLTVTRPRIDRSRGGAGGAGTYTGYVLVGGYDGGGGADVDGVVGGAAGAGAAT